MLCPNPKMMHVPLNVQVLVLIAWGRYICMKKKTHHHYCAMMKSLWKLTIVQSLFMNLDVQWNLLARWDPLDINCWTYLNSKKKSIEKAFSSMDLVLCYVSFYVRSVTYRLSYILHKICKKHSAPCFLHPNRKGRR